MSGGSWDYVSFKFQEVGDRLLKENCRYRRALGKKVCEIADVMHDIEWADSGDTCLEDSLESIKKVITNQDVMDSLIEDAKKIRAELNRLIEENKSAK